MKGGERYGQFKFAKKFSFDDFALPKSENVSSPAAELALKSLTLKEAGAFDCIHNLDELFYDLPSVHKTELSELLKGKTHQNDATLKPNLETISNFYVNWRYFFESESIGYSNFLLEFIHIVCDYAITEAENAKDL